MHPTRTEQVELTIKALRRGSNIDDSLFLGQYEKLVTGKKLSRRDHASLQRFGAIFLQSQDEIVAKFGYRIILQCSLASKDYSALYSIAQARDLMPLTETIERYSRAVAKENELLNVLFQAHRTNFVTQIEGHDQITRTRGQMELREFNAREQNAVVVAPTSYGKSEMLIERAYANRRSATCIVVPSKALIAQTRAALLDDQRLREERIRIITHQDSYANDKFFIAVMTQERLQRLLVENPYLKITQLLIDEAHNLLSGDDRAILLSQVIMIAKARNENLAVTYYSPFLAPDISFAHVGPHSRNAKNKSVHEHVKSELFHYGALGKQLQIYDQFLDRSFPSDEFVPDDDLKAIERYSGRRTIVYVNKPRDAQKLAIRLSQAKQLRTKPQLSREAAEAIEAISDLIDPKYDLVEAIRGGVVFHHGQIPEILRHYVENLFSEDSSEDQRVLIANSSLLEGVNTPADRLIVLSPKRGPRHLTPTAFRNLVGRVARFGEIFSRSKNNLHLLQPRIYLLHTEYAASNWNIRSFLKTVMDQAVAPRDRSLNPLLKDSEPSKSPDASSQALEFLENVEPGTTRLSRIRLAQTRIGKVCFQYGVRDFDVFENEHAIQARADLLSKVGKIGDIRGLIEAIFNVFLTDTPLINAEALARVRASPAAQNFYTMLLTWRSNNEPYKRMIWHFVKYWEGLENSVVYIGPTWGEIPFGKNGHKNLFVNMQGKSHKELVNLAIVKIKEEQDFVDFNLFKYVEILNSLQMVDPDIYTKLKYGTTDAHTICLINNGFSTELSRLVRARYLTDVHISLSTGTVEIQASLIPKMKVNQENRVLIYEASTL